ncbi:MAG TPA: serine hydrolase domain-containing protein [Rhizomicrobium sp.]|nr:serine hydrolase domain-containing protein [Rhizomicrobium sp.]
MRLRSLALPFALIAAAFAMSSPAAPASGAALATAEQPHALEKADLEAWLDGFVPYALKSGDIAGAVVAVVKDGRVLVEKGYGYADVARKTPMDPERTLVRIGSTSKLFTWTAVMQLVEQHKLDLDRDVNDYLNFKVASKTGRPITLRDLMNHRAGFEEGLKDVLAVDPHALQSTEQYLKTHPRPMLFAPGEVPAYSNYGAALAGYIVQRVSGERFEDYVAQHILKPLDMQHTTFEQPLPERFRAAMAKGYMTASSPPHPFEFVVTGPAGSAAATADDMTRFMIAQLQLGRLGDHAILSADTARRMQSPSETSLPGFSTMAHGFFYDRHNGRLVIGHGGDTIVFHTELDLLPGEGVGIFYNFNSRGKNDAVYGARELLFDEFMDRYFPAPPQALMPTLSSAARDAQEIAGLYESSRRVEHGFLSFFYLLQQSSIGTNADGTITAPPGPGGQSDTTFREIGPQLWRQKNGTRELALRDVDGVKTVIDSTDPTSVLQAVPFLRSQSLNLTVLLASVAILFWSLVLWLVSPLLRRGEPARSAASPSLRRMRLYLRGAALVDAAYLAAWTMLFLPILSYKLEVYSYRLDPVVLALECSGLLAIGAACAGLWSTWRVFREGAPLLSKIWSAAVSLALLGVVWIGAMGGLIGINLNY